MEHATPTPRKLSFGLGSLLLLVTLSAVSVAWWLEHNRPPVAQYDVTGPIWVEFQIRRNENSTPSRRIHGVLGLNFRADQITVHTAKGGVVVPKEILIEFEWFKE